MTWGKKKYKPVDLNEPNDNIVIYPSLNREVRHASFQNKRNAGAKVAIERGMRKVAKKNVLIIKEYMSFLHSISHMNIEVHHWKLRSEIQRNDYFICCLTPEEHKAVHANGPKKFVEDRGMENLLLDSANLFAKWIQTEEAQKHKNFVEYYGMLKNIHQKPTDFEYVLECTRDCVNEIRYKR